MELEINAFSDFRENENVGSEYAEGFDESLSPNFTRNFHHFNFVKIKNPLFAKFNSFNLAKKDLHSERLRASIYICVGCLWWSRGGVW